MQKGGRWRAPVFATAALQEVAAIESRSASGADLVVRVNGYALDSSGKLQRFQRCWSMAERS